MKRLFPRDDGRVSGEADPRPLLVSLTAVVDVVAGSTATSSVTTAPTKKDVVEGLVSATPSDFITEDRESPVRAELARTWLGRGDGGGLEDVEGLPAVAEVPDVDGLSASSVVVHCRTSSAAIRSAMTCHVVREVTSLLLATACS